MSTHQWITFPTDADIRVCARCETPWPTDAPCTNDVTPMHPAIAKMKQALAALQAALVELER